jgi:hypothetical protein
LIKVEREGRVIAVRNTAVAAAQPSATNGEASESSLASANGVEEAIPTADHSFVAHQHFTRPPTSSGGRNMQDTTFSLSAEYPSKTTNFNYFYCILLPASPLLKKKKK